MQSAGAAIPLIAIGAGSDEALLEAYRAGCDDYVDRHRSHADIAAHVRQFLSSREDGFQPTQVLSANDTSLSCNISALDPPGVIQMLMFSSGRAQVSDLGQHLHLAGYVIGAGWVVHRSAFAVFSRRILPETLATIAVAKTKKKQPPKLTEGHFLCNDAEPDHSR
jgi:DNA-binding response OmpR family regulator